MKDLPENPSYDHFGDFHRNLLIPAMNVKSRLTRLRHDLCVGSNVGWAGRLLRRLLADDCRRAGSSVYSSYIMFLRDVAKALKGGVVAGSRVIPNHLRDEICL